MSDINHSNSMGSFQKYNEEIYEVEDFEMIPHPVDMYSLMKRVQHLEQQLYQDSCNANDNRHSKSPCSPISYENPSLSTISSGASYTHHKSGEAAQAWRVAAGWDPPEATLSQVIQETAQLDQRLIRVEAMLNHALHAIRAMHAEYPFLHRLKVKDLTGKGQWTIGISSPNATVRDLMTQLIEEHGLSEVGTFRLVWAGQVLKEKEFVCATVPHEAVVILLRNGGEGSCHSN
jgi:hypothetical protein